MKTTNLWTLAAALLCVLLIAGAVYAQAGGGFDLTWSTIDGGGATTVSGGGYELGGTIGQYDAGPLTGGTFTLTGGFWGGTGTQYRVVLPSVMRNRSGR